MPLSLSLFGLHFAGTDLPWDVKGVIGQTSAMSKARAHSRRLFDKGRFTLRDETI